jgi:hypothetical protein
MDVRQTVRQQMVKKGITVPALSLSADVPERTLYDFMGGRNIGCEALGRVFDALGLLIVSRAVASRPELAKAAGIDVRGLLTVADELMKQPRNQNQ